MRASAIIALLVCMMAASTIAARPVHADDTKEAKREAQRHFDAGKQLIKKRSFDEAIAELQKAYDLDPRSEHLYNLAVANHLKGDTEQAMKYYRAFLAENPSGKAARDAKRFLGQLEAKAAEREAQLAAERAEAERIKAAEEQRQAEARRVADAIARAEAEERRAIELQGEIDAANEEVKAADRELADATTRRDRAQVLARRWEADARRAPSAGGRGRRIFGALLMTSGAAAVSYAAYDLLEPSTSESSLGQPVLGAGAGAVVVGLVLYVWGESAVGAPRSRQLVERLSIAPRAGSGSFALTLAARF